MSQVEEIIECPRCGGECGYVIDIRTDEEWCGCLKPDCDYGWQHLRDPETGQWLEEIVKKATFHQIPYSDLHPIEQLPIQIMIDSLEGGK